MSLADFAYALELPESASEKEIRTAFATALRIAVAVGLHPPANARNVQAAFDKAFPVAATAPSSPTAPSGAPCKVIAIDSRRTPRRR